MVKIAGPKAANLNEAAKAKQQERATREAQEADLVRRYGDALRLVAIGSEDAASQELRSMLSHPLIIEAWRSREKRAKGGEPFSPQLERLVYLVLKNVAEIEHHSSETPSQLCLAMYSDAVAIDGSDAVLWLNFGGAACKADALGIARMVYERGLSINTGHPLLLDALLQVVVQLGDVDTAQFLALEILKTDAYHPTALQVLHSAPSAALIELAASAADNAIVRGLLQERRLTSLATAARQLAAPASTPSTSVEPTAGSSTAVVVATPGDIVTSDCSPTLKLDLVTWVNLVTQVAMFFESLTKQGTQRLKLWKSARLADRKAKRSGHGILPYTAKLLQDEALLNDAALLTDGASHDQNRDQTAEEGPSGPSHLPSSTARPIDTGAGASVVVEAAAATPAERDAGAASGCGAHSTAAAARSRKQTDPEKLVTQHAALVANVRLELTEAAQGTDVGQRLLTGQSVHVRRMSMEGAIAPNTSAAGEAGSSVAASTTGVPRAAKADASAAQAPNSGRDGRQRDAPASSSAPQAAVRQSMRKKAGTHAGRRVRGSANHETNRLHEDQKRQEEDSDQHARNVAHLFGPLTVADAGRGPSAVPLPPSLKPAKAHDHRKAVSEQGGGVDEAFTARALVPVGRFIETLLVSREEGYVVLNVGMVKLAEQILAELCASHKVTLPGGLAKAILRLDASYQHSLPPVCRLFLAELYLDAASALEQVHPAEKRGKSSKTKTTKAAKASTKGAAAGRAATEGADRSKVAREAEQYRTRAEKHLSTFTADLVRVGSVSDILLALAADSNDTDQDSDAMAIDASDDDTLSSAAALQLRHCLMRFHYASYRIAWQRSAIDAAALHLRHCRRLCHGAPDAEDMDPPLGACLLDPVLVLPAGEDVEPARLALSHCESSPRIDVGSTETALRQLRVHEVLKAVPAVLARHGACALFAQVAHHLLCGSHSALPLFPGPKDYVAALMQLLAVLEPPAAAQQTQAAADANGHPEAAGQPTNAEAAQAGAADRAPFHDDGDDGAVQEQALQGLRAELDLSSQQVAWLRLSCSMHLLTVTLRPIVSSTYQDAPGATATSLLDESMLLAAGLDRTGHVMGQLSGRPPKLSDDPKAPTPKVSRVLSMLEGVVPLLHDDISAPFWPTAGGESPGSEVCLDTPTSSDVDMAAGSDEDEPAEPSVSAQALLRMIRPTLATDRPYDLTTDKMTLVAFLELVYWGQQGLATEAPCQPESAAQQQQPAIVERKTREFSLYQALQRAQYAVSLALMLLHALQATVLRRQACSQLVHVLAASGGRLPAAPEADGSSDSVDPPSPEAATATVLASTIQTSLATELDLLRGVHLLLNDRGLLLADAEGGEPRALKFILDRLKVLQGGAAWLREVLGVQLTVAEEALSDGDEEEAEPEEPEVVAGDAAPARPRPSGTLVTVQQLLDAGLLEPGPDVLVINFSGYTWTGDLLPDGTIQADGISYSALSSFALAMIHKINPTRKSFNGWRVVSFKGKALEKIRAEFTAKQLEEEQRQDAEDAAMNEGGVAASESSPAPPDGPEAADDSNDAVPRIPLSTLAQEQRQLEGQLDEAYSKCIYSVFGVKLDPDVEDNDWGGCIPQRSGSRNPARAAAMDMDTALEVFDYIKQDLQHILADPYSLSGRALQRHKEVVWQLYEDLPVPPAEVQAVWSTVAGPLLDAATVPTPATILTLPVASLHAMLPLIPRSRPPTPRDTPSHSPSPAASRAGTPALITDPRVTTPHRDVRRLVYYAVSVLQPPLDEVEDLALFSSACSADAKRALDEGCRVLRWDLLFEPRRTHSWMHLAQYYEACVDCMLSDAARLVDPREWPTSEHAEMRGLVLHVLDSAMRCAAVCTRLADAAGDVLMHCMGLHHILICCWTCLQSVPPGTGFLGKVLRDELFTESLEEGSNAAQQLVASGPGMFLPSPERLPPWSVHIIWGKILGKRARPDRMQQLAAFATAAAIAVQYGDCVIECLHHLHSTRVQLLLPMVPQALLTEALQATSEQPVDGCSLEAAMRIASGDAAQGAEPPAAELLQAISQHCFLEEFSDHVHCTMAATTRPSRSSRRSSSDCLDAQASSQQVALLLIDAMSALRWCTAACPHYYRSRRCLAQLCIASGQPQLARQELAHVLCKSDGSRFEPDRLSQTPPLAWRSRAAVGWQRSEAARAAAKAQPELPPPQRRGLRPADGVPLGRSQESVMDYKFSAMLTRCMVLYVRACREGGAWVELSQVLQWGLSNRWGKDLDSDFPANLEHFGELVTGLFLSDVAARIASAVGANNEVTHPQLRDALHQGLMRGREACDEQGVAAQPHVDQTLLRLLEAAWNAHTLLCSGSSATRSWRSAVASVAAAAATPEVADAFGPAVAPIGVRLATEQSFELFAQVYVKALMEQEDHGAIMTTLMDTRAQRTRSEHLVPLLWNSYVDLLQAQTRRLDQLLETAAGEAAGVQAMQSDVDDIADSGIYDAAAATAAMACTHHQLQTPLTIICECAGASAGMKAVVLLALEAALRRVNAACKDAIAATAATTLRGLVRMVRLTREAYWKESVEAVKRHTSLLIVLQAQVLAVLAWCKGVAGCSVRPTQADAFAAMPHKTVSQAANDVDAQLAKQPRPPSGIVLPQTLVGHLRSMHGAGGSGMLVLPSAHRPYTSAQVPSLVSASASASQRQPSGAISSASDMTLPAASATDAETRGLRRKRAASAPAAGDPGAVKHTRTLADLPAAAALGAGPSAAGAAMAWRPFIPPPLARASSASQAPLPSQPKAPAVAEVAADAPAASANASNTAAAAAPNTAATPQPTIPGMRAKRGAS